MRMLKYLKVEAAKLGNLIQLQWLKLSGNGGEQLELKGLLQLQPACPPNPLLVCFLHFLEHAWAERSGMLARRWAGRLRAERSPTCSENIVQTKPADPQSDGAEAI